MVTIDNIATKLWSILVEKYPNDEVNEWRLLGQEQNGTLLFSWVQSNKAEKTTKIGQYASESNNLTILHCFKKIVNCVQASIDSTKAYLAYVLKDADNIYKPYLLKFNAENDEIYDLELERSKQLFVQFLYQKHSILVENSTVKFLILIHQECILQYQIKTDATTLEKDSFIYESLVRKFTWAQWDPIHQTLYYIHNRKPSRCLVEGEDEEVPLTSTKIAPTLSGLQFHDDLPHESVLNIPLNLPHISTITGNCNIYEDDTVPLRIHDCSLDLIVLTDSNGYVCICHHYLYQPIQPPTELNDDDTTLIHFAYSVTVLHQSNVIQCVVPSIPWSKAKIIRPLFKFYSDHMLVFIPDVCTHLLDIGEMHEPTCHVTIKPLLTIAETEKICLTTLNDSLVINLATFDLIDMSVPTSLLVETFKAELVLGNRLSIVHYLILHRNELEVASELIQYVAERPLRLGMVQLLKEYLIGAAYASVHRNLPSDASHLVNLLPISTQHMGNELEVRIGSKLVCLSQDVLWNASMMLLSPQQRIVPYRSDIWVRLWEKLARITKGRQRFRPQQVVEKLLVSLTCYQPEALSRSSTPMSPSGALGASGGISDFLGAGGGRKGQGEALPFYEIENCTASKQEHVISVNLRELSMHLLKQSGENRMSRWQWQAQTPMHVHAVATRYIAAQLEQSRMLCQILCRVATFDPRQELQKGFVYIEQLSEERRYILFTILERYFLAVESLAFPLPQGFTSFFTYAGYKTLRFDAFVQYTQRNVFELQVDVMKIVMADVDNSRAGVARKIKLLTLLPRARAKRLLGQWHHPASLMLRAREHALNILSGVGGGGARFHGQQGKSLVHPNEERLSALDTFLDLLTAKASLTELDFGLLIEATEMSTQNNNV